MSLNVSTRRFALALGSVETALASWLARYSVDLLRVALGLIFFGFGVLKFFPGLSPAEALATNTLHILDFGLVPAPLGLFMIASLETVIGLLLLTGLWMRIALLLLGLELIGILSPLLLLQSEMFRGAPYAPTLEGQYVIKDVVILAAGLVVAARALGAQMVAPGSSEPATASVADPAMVEIGEPGAMLGAEG
jgi:uncharacterized membrane protein YkgB